jgi:alpha-galactosidase
MIFLFKRPWQPFCIAVFVAAMLLETNLASAASATPDEMQQRDVWLQGHLLADKAQPPFSFVYDGKKSETLSAAWTKKATTKKLDTVRTQHTLAWTDPETGLQIRCVAVEYADLPAVDWVVYLSNTGDKDTPIIENIRPLDVEIGRQGKNDFTIHYSLGDSNTGQSFAPVDQVLTLAKPGPLVLAPVGGRSSDGHLPFFNVDWQTGGIAAAIGWSGQWEAGFQVNPKGDLQFRAGQQLTHLKLLPGETIRTPKILLVFWNGGEAIRGNNLLRRVMMAHYMPRHDGRLVLPPICGCVGWVEPDGSYEKPHVDAMKPMAKLGFEVLWSDMDPQQWYPIGFPEGTGTWEVDAMKYPHGLKPVGDAAKTAGIGYLLWFEPERVHTGTKIDKEHPEYVIKADGEWSRLFRLHDEKARKWITDLIDVHITAGSVTWVRWDFNVPPLGFWRRNDAPDRQGMTEIRHIENLYAMWDDLRARHPGLMIDNCASGGRRIDIETCSRSLPLWHSDMQCEGPKPAADQLQNAGLHRWIPLHGCAAFGLEPSYPFRSAMTAGNVLALDDMQKRLQNTAGPQADEMRKTVAIYNRLRPLMLGDFYPLLPHDESPTQWYGYQFDNPELKGGFVMAFRRDKSPEAAKTIRLNGLDPAASYLIEDVDAKTTKTVSGKELLEKGLTVEIMGQPGSALLIYERSK